MPLKDSSKFLIFGGKQFTVICIDCNLNGDTNGLNIHRLFKPLVCEDWLHSATWVDTNTVALLTAHNAVQVPTKIQFQIPEYNLCNKISSNIQTHLPSNTKKSLDKFCLL